MTTLFLFLLFNVRGIVVDPAARPVEGARVACGSETTATDSRGQFELNASTCTVTISKEGFAAKTIRLEDNKEASIALALAPTSDQVVVSATGTPVAIAEAGVSATVFTNRDFEARANPSLQDYLREVPGIDIVQTGRNGGLTSIFARGGDDSSTLVLLDGVPLTDPGGAIDLVHLTTAGIDRMEVVRGPESALFGAEAASAVIQLFTKTGDAESNRPHGTAIYERGSFSSDHWTGSLSGGFVRKIDYSFTADQFRTTGEFPNDAYRITTGTANVGYRITDKITARVIFREFDSATGVPGQVFYGLINRYATESARDSTIGLHVDDARTSRFFERFSFGYHRNRDFFEDPGLGDPQTISGIVRTVPATPVPYVFFVGLETAGGDVRTHTSFPFAGDSLTITDRTNASYQGTLTENRGELVFGYQFERQAGLVSTGNVARYDNGVFVHEQYRLTPRIFFTAGGRVQQSSTFGTEFTPRGSITFRLPTETFVRFSAARGVTEPSLLENFANESFFVGNPALKPEKTNSYEIGAYREWFRRRLRTDLAIFRNSFRDLIEFSFANDPGTWVNVNQSWARGGEASGTFRVNKHAAVRAAYTRLYTRITQSSTGDLGQQLLRQPKNSGSMSVELSARRLTLIAGSRIFGERRDDDFVFGVNRAHGYEYVFISGSWQATRHLTPFIRIENALDELYQEALGYSSLSRAAYGGLKFSW
jgi:outer membrane cobalamin receptor